nr:hypothetical protein [Nitrosospira sp. Nsp14]
MIDNDTAAAAETLELIEEAVNLLIRHPLVAGLWSMDCVSWSYRADVPASWSFIAWRRLRTLS